jgi:hypothetical protein
MDMIFRCYKIKNVVGAFDEIDYNLPLAPVTYLNNQRKKQASPAFQEL